MQLVSDLLIQTLFINCFSPPPSHASAFILFSCVVVASLQNLLLDKRGDMPSYILAETVHNMWL